MSTFQQTRMILIYNNDMEINRSTSTPCNALADPLPAGQVGSTGVAPDGVRRISSQALFGGVNEVEIEHNGLLYRLRQTSLGKLILTK